MSRSPSQTLMRGISELLVLSKTAEKRYTLGVVYEPDTVDTQGEFAKAADIEAAAWEFLARMQTLAKSGFAIVKACQDGEDVEVDVTDLVKAADGLDDQHAQTDEPLGTIVESFVAPAELRVNGHVVKAGAWLLGVIWTPEMFAKIKAGERTGLSMFGHATRVEV